MEKSQIQQFLNFVKQDSNIEQEEFKKLLKLFEFRTFNSKDHIIDPTEEKSSVFFILSGLIRYYYLAEDGKEWWEIGTAINRLHPIAVIFAQSTL